MIHLIILDPHIQYWKQLWSKSVPCLAQCWSQSSLDQFSLLTVGDLACASVLGLVYCATRHWGRSVSVRLNFKPFQVPLYSAIIYSCPCCLVKFLLQNILGASQQDSFSSKQLMDLQNCFKTWNNQKNACMIHLQQPWRTQIVQIKSSLQLPN